MFYAYLVSIKSRLNGRTSVHHDTWRQFSMANRIFLKSVSALLSSFFFVFSDCSPIRSHVSCQLT